MCVCTLLIHYVFALDSEEKRERVGESEGIAMEVPLRPPQFVVIYSASQPVSSAPQREMGTVEGDIWRQTDIIMCFCDSVWAMLLIQLNC